MRKTGLFGRTLGAGAVVLALAGSACGTRQPSERVDAGADSSVQSYVVGDTVNPQVASRGDGVVVVGGSPSIDALPKSEGIVLTLKDGSQASLPAIPDSANALAVSVSTIGSEGVIAAVLRCVDRSVTIETLSSCDQVHLVTSMLEQGSVKWTTIPFDTPSQLASSVAKGGYLPVMTLSSPGERTSYLTVQAPVVGVSNMFELDVAGRSWTELAAPPPDAQTCATEDGIFAMTTANTATDGAVVGNEPPGQVAFSRLEQNIWNPIQAPTSPNYAGTPYLVCSDAKPYFVSSNPDRSTIRFEGVTDPSDRSEARLRNPQPLSFAVGTNDRLFAVAFSGETVGWVPGADPTVRQDLDAAPTAATYNSATKSLVVVAGNPGHVDSTKRADSSTIVSLRY